MVLEGGLLSFDYAKMKFRFFGVNRVGVRFSYYRSLGDAAPEKYRGFKVLSHVFMRWPWVILRAKKKDSC